MIAARKVSRLLAPTVPLVLTVDDGAPGKKLELRLAWTMKGVILTEAKLREVGININIIQNPGVFWKNLDSALITAAVWGMASQEHPEYHDDEGEGFETIASFLITENCGKASDQLKEAFLESLSPARREEIREAERQMLAEGSDSTSPSAPEVPQADPTLAPAQS